MIKQVYRLLPVWVKFVGRGNLARVKHQQNPQSVIALLLQYDYNVALYDKLVIRFMQALLDSLNGELTVSAFLKDYWQKKPVVIRNVFPNFDDPIDEHDLAGLAQEEEVDSRIIGKQHNQWFVEHGPFEDFESVCQGQWTLLVQGVDKYIDDVAPILAPFRFMPNWRLDDLMVSFAIEGAGVGAHLDQYDVFLVQGKGKRQWRVGEKGQYTDVFPHPQLKQIEGFEPIIDTVLNPGDVLYIPPGFPHDGIALSDCLTYSVGFRAPDTQLLSTVLCNHLSDFCETPRYTDPQRQSSNDTVTIAPSDVSELKALLHRAIDSSGFEATLLEALSEQGLPEFIDDETLSEQELSELLQNEVSLQLSSGNRPIFSLSSHPNRFFMNGETFSFEKSDLSAVKTLLQTESLHSNDIKVSPSVAFLQTLTTLISRGYLHIHT